MTAGLLLAGACAVSPPKLEASDAWARESASSSTAAYLTIANRGGADDRLVAVQSSRGTAGVHVTTNDGGIARMRPAPAEGLAIPAGGELALRPGGAHIMLTGLRQPLRPGENVPMTLVFEKSAALPVSVAVRPAVESGHGGH